MSALTSIRDYCRAIGLNTHVVKIVGFLDKYIEDPEQFSLTELKEALALAETCKKIIPELLRLTDDVADPPLNIDIEILIDTLEAHIESFFPNRA